MQQSSLSQSGSFSKDLPELPISHMMKTEFHGKPVKTCHYMAPNYIYSFIIGHVLFPPHPKSCILCQVALPFVLLLFLSHSLFSTWKISCLIFQSQAQMSLWVFLIQIEFITFSLVPPNISFIIWSTLVLLMYRLVLHLSPPGAGNMNNSSQMIQSLQRCLVA